MKKIELLAPAGSMANLKAAVSNGADAIYLGMNRFSARDYATNFNETYLPEAIRITKSNNVKCYLAMNTLVKNSELRDYFDQISFAYSAGVDAVIIQQTSFIELIKKNFPDLRVHISTQAGVMNSLHANLLRKADRITLARELSLGEIQQIRNNFSGEIEIFCQGALCASVSGQCLFSSFLGGRSGNRGKCAQPCRKKYNGSFLLSTKELCLIRRIPDITRAGINAAKIEGRMRAPYYVATATKAYRKAIDSFYDNNFSVSKETMQELESAFTREFTEGKFSGENIFNRSTSTGVTNPPAKTMYTVQVKDVAVGRKKILAAIPSFKATRSEQRLLCVKAYNEADAVSASKSGADVIYLDAFHADFAQIRSRVTAKVFAATPKILCDEDIQRLKQRLIDIDPDGILAGNSAMIGLDLGIPLHLDSNLNSFNDIDVDSLLRKNILPIISPELSIKEISEMKNKNFIVPVHGKIQLMTLRHDLPEGTIQDEKGGKFLIHKIFNGSEIINEREFGLLSKSTQLLQSGINRFMIDTDRNVSQMVRFYRNILDGKPMQDSRLKDDYVLAWSYRGVI